MNKAKNTSVIQDPIITPVHQSEYQRSSPNVTSYSGKTYRLQNLTIYLHDIIAYIQHEKAARFASRSMLRYGKTMSVDEPNVINFRSSQILKRKIRQYELTYFISIVILEPRSFHVDYILT